VKKRKIKASTAFKVI